MGAQAAAGPAVAVVLICSWLLFVGGSPDNAAGDLRKWLSVRKHLRRLNKPTVKSIKSPDGDIIDCVNIGHQQAFDHPYLKNHTIQHAIAYVEGDKYYGAKAIINVWEPNIQQHNEFSLSQLWILGGSFGQDLNSIEAGWQVSPDLYGDNNTRLFTYWTSDAYQATGCYNLLCSGFIQISSEIAMGATISPISHYGGSQFDISILVWKVENKAHHPPQQFYRICRFHF